MLAAENVTLGAIHKLTNRKSSQFGDSSSLNSASSDEPKHNTGKKELHNNDIGFMHKFAH
ncbi:hypothetical protein HK099_002846, partial [Clydaea vesicula]